jgi:Lamin Tail Domain
MRKAAGFLIIILFCMVTFTGSTAAFTYTLQDSGCGGAVDQYKTHNTLFQIVGDELRTNAIIQQENYPAGCTICIRTDDGAGGTFDEEFTITINNIPPSVSSIVRKDGNPTNAATVDFTVTFRESVTGVDTGDFSLNTDGVSGASIDSVSGSGLTYTVTVDTGTGNGTIRLDLDDDDSISDGTDPLGPGDGSYNTGQDYTIDKTAPNVTSITRSDSNPTNASSVDFTVNFSESVSDIEIGDFVLAMTGMAAGTINNVSASSGTSITVNVNSISGDGTLGLNFDYDAQDNVVDEAGNFAALDFTGQAYTIDNTAPTVTINQAGGQSDPGTSSPINFTAVFSETVTGFDDTADVALSGGAGATTSTITGTGPYNVAVEGMTSIGTVIADINSGRAQDAAGNTNAASTFTDHEVTYSPPAPTVLSINRTDSNPTNASSVDFTVTFDQSVSGIDTGDFSLAPIGTTGVIASVSAGSGASVTVAVNTITGDGTLGLNLVDNDSVLNSLSNPLGGAGVNNGNFTGQVYTIDNTAPTVTINQADGQSDPGTSSPINFTAVFSETVTGFDDTADVALSGGAGATTSTITGTGPYNVAVEGMTSIGTVIADINSGRAQDAAGNTNAASTFTDHEVTYSPPAPTVLSINRTDSNPTNASSVDFTVTFDQSVSGIDTGDFSLAPIGTTGVIASVSAGSGTSVTVTVNTITGDGTLGLNLVDNDSVLNSLSNPLGGAGVNNGNFTGRVYDIDRVVPTVNGVSATTADATYYIGDTIDITVQFSEAVTVAGGPPTLTLETGASDAIVDYSSGSPSDTLTFSYTVLQNHTSADLDYLNTTALANGGGTIRDAVGTDATLTLATPGDSNSLGPNHALVINGTSRLVINEIDYNQGATDNAEFIEIKNVSGSSVNLNGYALQLVDSTAGPGVYQTINLANVYLAPGDYYVICNTIGSTVNNCDQLTSLGNDFIQDGSPDAIRLVKGIATLDTVSYGGDTAGYTESAGAPADSNSSDTYGLSRFPDGSDTDNNSADFILRCITPGETNSAVAPPNVCNTPPEVDLNGGGTGNDNTADFTENAGAVLIASAGTVTDINGGDIQSLTITVTNDLDGALESLALNASAQTAVDNEPHVSITPYNSGTGILLISGAGTIANYQTILQGIEYDNTDTDPDTTSRTITVVANDGTDDSTNCTSTVSITGINEPTVSTQAVTAISITTATGNGNITDLGAPNPTQHGVCWNTSANPTTGNSKTERGTAFATGAFTSAMTGLSANTTYYVRAYATNTAGTAYGAQVSFMTEPPPSTVNPPTVTTTAVSSITATTATSGGNVTSGGSLVTARGVCWSRSANPTDSYSKTTDGTGTGVFTSSITGLSANTTYHVRAYATNWYGMTSYGSDITFTTTDANIPTVTTTAVSSITGTTATSGGNVTSDGGSSVTAKGVCWCTSTNPTVSLSTKTTDGTGNDVFTSSITGLSANTTYHVKAYATNGSGTNYGSDITFTTTDDDLLPGVEPAPDIKANGQDGPVEVSYGMPVSVSVTLAPGSWFGQSADWWVAVYTPFDPPYEWYTYTYPEGWQVGILVGAQMPFFDLTTPFNVLDMVLPEGDYTFYFVVDGNMDGNPDATWLDSVEVYVRTTVTTTAVSSITGTTATSGGNVTSDGGSSVTARGVCWCTSENPTVSLSTKTTDGTGTGVFTSSITGLSANTTYHVRAYATNGSGTNYGSDITFTTTDDDLPPGVEPAPDIKANGQDGPVEVSYGMPVSISITLAPGSWSGQSADWWVAVYTPFDPPYEWYTYTYPEGWQAGILVGAQMPFFDLTTPFNVLDMVLPEGDYTFYFVVDGNMDGNPDATWLDSVEVYVE